MRRYLILIVAAGTLMLGCSSSDETSTPSSTTTSSVVISAANQKICADLTAFSDGLKVANIDLGTNETEKAKAIQGYFADIMPALNTLKASAPADLAPAIDTYIVRFTEVGTLDPSDEADQKTLSVMILAPDAELKEAETTLRTWSGTNCGLALPGDQAS